MSIHTYASEAERKEAILYTIPRHLFDAVATAEKDATIKTKMMMIRMQEVSQSAEAGREFIRMHVFIEMGSESKERQMLPEVIPPSTEVTEKTRKTLLRCCFAERAQASAHLEGEK